MKPLLCLYAGAAALAAAAPALSATLTSLDRSTFQSAIPGNAALAVQSFDTLPAGTILTTLNGVTYTSSVGSPLVTDAFLTSTFPNGLGRTETEFFLPDESATFGFSAAITAFAIDINSFATLNGTYQATLDNGDIVNSIFEVFPGAGTGQFIGFVSDNPFTRVTLSSTDEFAFTLDTLIYGQRDAVVSAVPEPESWAMMIAGFAMVGASVRRPVRSLARRV